MVAELVRSRIAVERNQGILSALPIIHLPTPGDHYSHATGSAIMTLVYELTRCHERAGGDTTIIVGENTRHDYPVGKCVTVAYNSVRSKPKRAADVLIGRFGLSRPFVKSVYRPATHVIPRDFSGAIVAHNAPAPLRMLRATAPKAKICLYCHNDLFETYTTAEARKTLASADRIFCLSKYVADGIARRLGHHDPRIRVIHSGVDSARFSRSNSNPQVDAPTIAFVGRVIPEKGVDLLLKAAATLPDLEFRVKVVGSNNFNANEPLSAYESQLRRIAELIQDRVEFIPFVDRTKVVDVFRDASIYCAPSNWNEPFNLTILEAMSTGLPIVASDKGGIPEVGGDAILYFSPPNIQQLANHIQMLITSSDAREEWGRKARQRAERFSWQSCYDHLINELSNDSGTR